MVQRDSPQVYVASRAELSRAEGEHLMAILDAYIFRRATVLVDSSAKKGIEMRIEHSLPPGLLGGRLIRVLVVGAKGVQHGTRLGSRIGGRDRAPYTFLSI